jgi:hypothetical protein
MESRSDGRLLGDKFTWPRSRQPVEVIICADMTHDQFFIGLAAAARQAAACNRRRGEGS